MNSKKTFLFKVNIQKYVAQIILVLLLVFFSVIKTDIFFTGSNFVSIVRQITTLGIATLGVSFVMISGELDFSAGAVYAFAGVSTALMYNAGVPIGICAILAIVMCVIIFCINSFISIHFKISRLVVSLAMSMTVSGLSCIITDNRTVYGLPDSIKWLGQDYLFGIPISTIIFMVMALVVSFILRKTYLGRYMFAIGGNEEVAFLSGINVNKIKYIASAIAGFMVAFAGLISMSRTFSGSAHAGSSLQFDVISAAVLGGVSITGGTGKTFGLVTGVLIIGVLSVGLNMMNLNSDSQQIFKGAMLLLAVILDSQSKKKATALK